MRALEIINYAKKNKEKILNFDYGNINETVFASPVVATRENKEKVVIENFDEIENLESYLQGLDISYGVTDFMPIAQIVWTQCRNILAGASINDPHISTNLYKLLHIICDFALNENADNLEKQARELIQEKFNITNDTDIYDKLKDIYYSIPLASKEKVIEYLKSL